MTNQNPAPTSVLPQPSNKVLDLTARIQSLSDELDSTQSALQRQINERKVAEENVRLALGVLSEERGRLKTILHSIGQGIVVTDGAGTIKMSNDLATDYIGLSPHRAHGLNLLTLIKDDLFSRIWEETADSGEDFAKQPIGIDVGGIPQHIWATRARFETDIGDVGFVTILQDMTHEREVDRMKTEFVSSVSHELRTPLTSIKGFIATILRDPEMDADRRIEFLGIANKESDRLIELIEDLLEISHLEAGRLQLNLEPCRIDTLIDHVLESLQPLIIQKGHTVSVLHQTGTSSLVCDLIKLQTCLNNLLTNAIKYTPDGGDIEVRSYGSEDGVRVEISDNGLGIPDEDLENIFTRFYRCASGRRVASGTGLGLPIVKEMIELHGGSVSVESELGQGSTFHIELPLPDYPDED